MGISDPRRGNLAKVQGFEERESQQEDDGEPWLDEEADEIADAYQTSDHPMDTPAMRKEHNRLMDWYYQEREKQAMNRYHMAIDHDFYDNIQWSPDDASEVRERGQMPIVYNECAPMVDWMIGTERRTRIDWKILPRTPDDVQGADIKTKVMKYLSDVNSAAFHRSSAFSDAVKGGIGWVEDGVRLDPTQELIFSRREDWRNVIWDSACYELDLSDSRYLFRWRWVDLDIALACFPDRAAVLKKSAMANLNYTDEEDDVYYMNQLLNEMDSSGGHSFDRRSFTTDFGNINVRRSRVKLIEAQYRKPVPVKIIVGGPFNKKLFNEQNPAMVSAHEAGQIEVEDHVMMRVHRAVMTEDSMIRAGLSPYNHNRFTLTPIWCYRRSRDRMPYGAIRRVRDIQESLNKRMSKALWLISTNQILTEVGATDDFDELADEAARPDGMLVVRAGKKLEIRRDAEQVQHTLQLAEIDANKIQRSAGVADENMGRQTNAISGEAIKARQLQGSVVTTEPFDNLRQAVQWQGEKRLSLAEQFISEERAIRLTEGQKGKVEWLKINVPEVQDDGSVVFKDDITASAADFVVAEQDFHGTLRQVMFENMMAMVAKAPDPIMQLRLLILAFDFSDMPNKDEIVSEIRKMANLPDPNKEPTPEEQQAMAAAQAREQKIRDLEMATAESALAEGQARAAKLNAEAEEIRGRALDGSGNADEINKIVEESRRVQEQAAQEIEDLSQKLAQATIDARNKTMEIGKRADTEIEVARIAADAEKYVAELSQQSTGKLDAFAKRLEDISAQVKDLNKVVSQDSAADKVEESSKKIDELGATLKEEIKGVLEQVKADRAEDKQEAAKEKKSEVAAPAPVIAPNISITLETGAIQVDAKPGATSKTVTVQGPGGKTATATIKTEPDKGADK